MKREITTYFWYFGQNNSGGYYMESNIDGIGKNIIIEALNVKEAIQKMNNIIEDYKDYCKCCGQRWSDWVDENDKTTEPMIYDDTVIADTSKVTIV